MYDVEALEKEWKKYKRKKLLPWSSVIIFLILIAAYINNREIISQKISNYFQEKNKQYLVSKEQNKTTNTVQKSVTVPQVTVNLINESNSTNSTTKSYKPMQIELSDDPNAEKEHERKYLEIIVTDKMSKSNNNSNEELETLEVVEKRYNQDNNYEDALYLAQGYYKQEAYKKAQKWALISNNLNNSSEESWLIFAKSKAKLGDYRAGEKILEAYLKENSSAKAEKLLKMMESGNF